MAGSTISKGRNGGIRGNFKLMFYWKTMLYTENRKSYSRNCIRLSISYIFTSFDSSPDNELIEKQDSFNALEILFCSKKTSSDKRSNHKRTPPTMCPVKSLPHLYEK